MEKTEAGRWMEMVNGKAGKQMGNSLSKQRFTRKNQ